MRKRHPNRVYSNGTFVLVIIFLMIMGVYNIYQHTILTFCMPTTAQEYDDDIYREKAEDIAEKFLAKAQAASWNEAGFSGADATKSAKIERLGKEGSVAQRTRYQGNGVYDVRTGTLTTLTAHAPDNRKQKDVMQVQQIYIVRVHMHPKRRWYGTVDMGWKVESVQLAQITPSIEKVNDTIAHWPALPSTNGNW